MQNWVVPVVAVAVLLVLFALFPLQHTWLAILIMLGLIFYALFYNPMHHLHKAAFGEGEKVRPKRKLRKR